MSKPESMLCCGNFETCTKPCTPRGAYLQERGLPLNPEIPPLQYDPASVAFSPADHGTMTEALATPGYESLAGVLCAAYNQAAIGKGAERHAQGHPFDQQPMQQLIALYGPGFALGQAAKKAQESLRLPRDRAVAELLGAINYLAGAVIAQERQPETN